MTNAITRVIWQYLSGQCQSLVKPAVLETLDGVAKDCDRSSIFLVTALSLDEAPEIRQRAWEVLDQLLAEVTLEDLPKIDALMRDNHFDGMTIIFSHDLENRVIVTQMNRIHELSVPTNVLGMLSFSSDGYVREAALRQLAGRFEGNELPFILLRVNDWVDKIHELAVKAIEERLSLEYSHYFAENIYLVRRLWGARRHEHEPLRILIERLLALPDNESRLLEQLHSTDRQVRRYVFELLIPGGVGTISESAIVAGLSHADVLIRVRAVEAAFKHFSKKQIDALVPQLLKDRFAPVRKEALRWIADHDWANWRKVMTDSFFDRNSGVREFARYRLPEEDAASLYVKSLHDSRANIEPTLRAIIETKTSVPVQLIEPYLSHPQGKVRAAAYGVLFGMSDRKVSRLITKALSDKSGSCAREAHKYLLRDPSVMSGDLLWEHLTSAVMLSAKMTCVHAISLLNKWESLPFLLRAKGLPEPELQETINRAIAEWLHTYNRSFVAPDMKQLELCREAFRENAQLLNASQRRELEFLLKR